MSSEDHSSSELSGDYPFGLLSFYAIDYFCTEYLGVSCSFLNGRKEKMKWPPRVRKYFTKLFLFEVLIMWELSVLNQSTLSFLLPIREGGADPGATLCVCSKPCV